MGSCQSSPSHHAPLVMDGDEAEFQRLFSEEKVLGTGKFSKVKLVREMTEGASGKAPLAAKILETGASLSKNNPNKRRRREEFERESLILKSLAGEQNCLKLHSLYESPDFLCIVTEYCGGGNMMEYVCNIKAPLKITDVSRIAFQLLGALNHCHNHGIIHRDVRPANCLFKHSSENASLRLVDFGLAAMDSAPVLAKAVSNGSDAETAPIDEAPSGDEGGEKPTKHTTLAGSPFYVSPEMFQRNYASNTDLWSVGVTLYVLVAGYPADSLQEAFNIIHAKRGRDLRNLPGLPDGMPDTYFDMLEDLLTYRHANRKNASAMLMSNFVQLHRSQGEGGATEKRTEETSCSSKEQLFYDAESTESATSVFTECNDGRNQDDRQVVKRISKSVVVDDSIEKHKKVLDYDRFERCVTTLLGTTLNRGECDKLIQASSKVLQMDPKGNKMKLRAITISELKEVLKSLDFNHVVEMIDELPETSAYERFAFHLPQLQPFGSIENHDVGEKKTKFSRKSAPNIGSPSNWSNEEDSVEGRPSIQRRFTGSITGTIARNSTIVRNSTVGNSRTVGTHRHSFVEKWKSFTTKFPEYEDEDEPLNRSMHGFP